MWLDPRLEELRLCLIIYNWHPSLAFLEIMEFMSTLRRRRDDEVEAPEEEAEEEAEAQTDFDWEAVIDEAAGQGESGSGEKFYDAEDEVQESPEESEEAPAVPAPSSAQQKKTETAGVDPSGPFGHLPESMMNKLQVEFERARADRIQADLEKAQAENARLLALLQPAKNPPKP
ncbi:hypothetical protein Dimus_028762 [Dionaea muscipula]